MIRRSFASDNNSGIHPEVVDAILAANVGHCKGYGADEYTQKAEEKFKEIFGENTESFFVFNGTGANVTIFSSVLRSFQAVICSDVAHIHTDEGGAPEHIASTKLLDVPSHNGKITVDDIRHFLHLRGDEHHVQPKIISLTNSTEYGTVYTADEIKAFADFAHQHNMWLHIDGARIANAAVSLSKGLKEITVDLGVDLLSFGGTKNGIMLGEAILVFDSNLAQHFKFHRKQNMQLASKMRFISAQISALLTHDLWKRNAENANAMAKYLAQRIQEIPQLEIVFPVEANAVFVKMNPELIPVLQQKFFFYVFDAENHIVRWMCSFDTQKDDIDEFVDHIQKVVSD